MEFKEFKEKYFGKSVEEIKEGLMEEKDFWKDDIELVQICINIDFLIEKIIKLKKDHPSIYLIQKRIIILKSVLEMFTTLQSLPEIDSFEDFSIEVEDAIYRLHSKARFVRAMVEDGLKETIVLVLEELYKVMNNQIPNEEQLTKLTKDLDSMFNNLPQEKLDVLNSIMAYNDPALKEIKDGIYNNVEINRLEQNILEKELKSIKE